MALTERCHSASLCYISLNLYSSLKGSVLMLSGKRAVISGGGRGFGQALSVWLAREGVEVDFCARRADDIKKTCRIIAAEGGVAKGHLCDLNQPESISHLSSQLLNSDKPIDIFNSQCCSVAVRDNRRSTWRRDSQYHQFRPDRFHPTDSGIASRIAAL